MNTHSEVTRVLESAISRLLHTKCYPPGWLTTWAEYIQYGLSLPRGQHAKLLGHDPPKSPKTSRRKGGGTSGSDQNLQLVYVPQMMSNEIAAYFNVVPANILLNAAGLDINDPNVPQNFTEIWVSSSIEATISFALAFKNQAIAFEVHEVIDRVAIPSRIMKAFTDDDLMIDCNSLLMNISNSLYLEVVKVSAPFIEYLKVQ